MPGFTIGTADRGSNPFLYQPWLVDDTYLVDELMCYLRFYGIRAPFVGVNRTNIPDTRTLGATFCVPMDPSVASGESFGAAPASQAEQPYNSLTPRADFYLKRLVHRVIASRALQLNFASPNDMIQWQTQTALKAMWYEYCRVVYNGLGGGQGDREFLGLTALVTGTQRITGTLNIPNDLDAGLSRLRPADPKSASRVIVMNSVTRAIYLQQLRAAGVEPSYCVHPVLGQVLCHADAVVAVTNFIGDDLIPQPPVFTTQIFLLVLGRENDGFYGIYQDGVGSNGVVTMSGTLDMNRDAQFLEVSWNVGTVLASRSAAVAIDEIGLTTPASLT